MYEVRLHGRGGQGTVLAATILATALVAEEKFAIAIPSFGFERRGAPVAAYLRMDAREIRRMTNIYCPDCVICIDPTVAQSVDIFEGIRPGATLVQASSRAMDELKRPPAVLTVGLCDAVSIALALFGRAITNTIMLGAFARTTGLVSLGALERALADSDFRDAGLEQNVRALQRGFDETVVQRFSREAAA
jgi:pyruvate ferredoxin oxidoreductase gamma subunit/phenylglyoxylate dehydrogenase gamma subunit